MVHRLFGAEPGHRRKHTERVAGQEDDRAGMAALAALHGVGDEVQGIGAAGVLGDRRVVEVDAVRGRLVDHVLEHGAERERVPDIRFLLLRELDDLRVAATLDVEHALIAPAVLVIADQQALGVR